MINVPTTPHLTCAGGEEIAPYQHPHHHPLGGVGVWRGYEKFEIAGGERPGSSRRKNESGMTATVWRIAPNSGKR